MDIKAIKKLEAETVIKAVSGAQFKVQAATGNLVWLSKPDDFEAGWRCFSAEDLAVLNVEKA